MKINKPENRPDLHFLICEQKYRKLEHIPAALLEILPSSIESFKNKLRRCLLVYEGNFVIFGRHSHWTCPKQL